tara:strand:- start:1904 stop:2161 length:258 start_codon:yes stop_codon:yes gene_type:complete
MEGNMPEAPQLNIGDLMSIIKIIDACSERGAFKGNEMGSVGAVRDRIAAFAEANQPVEEPQENDNESLGDTDDGITPIDTDVSNN